MAITPNFTQDRAFPSGNPASSWVDPETSPAKVLESEIKEYHFHIYFHQANATSRAAAVQLRDAVLTLRRDGVFVAVPLWRVNDTPMGPHPVGSYEIWVPSSSFAQVYSYLLLNRGELSVLVHSLTRQERTDHSDRAAWLGPPFPIDLGTLPLNSSRLPLQYPVLGLGYTAKPDGTTLEERKKAGAKVEELLKSDKEAAPAPLE